MWKRRNVEVQKCGSAENPEYSKVRITAGTGVNMKEKILNILQGADDYISGQYLCEMLGVSRTAVWKCIRQLQEEGYVIDAVKNRGYCLRESGDILSLHELKRVMETGWMGQNLYFFDKIDSTNLEAKRLADGGAPEGTLVVADCQQSGRGRLGRVWTSPAGCGLWMSMVLKPAFSAQQASMVTLVTAMAVMDAIEEVSGVQVQIKWPNDLVVQGRKVCGILTEMSMEEGRISFIVPGIGINVNNDHFPEELSEKAISLAMLTGSTLSRAALAGAVCRSFEKYYADFLEHGNLAGMMDAYNERLVNRNQQVVISDGAGSFKCLSEGIDETGALLVQREDGRKEAISSGEVSVRGVYGYV